MYDLKVWFFIIAGLLGLGIPFLFLGLELPDAMHAAILNEAAEYVILDEEDEEFWAMIPGRMKVEDIKQFYIFECSNPEDVAALGLKPIMKEIGPFNYSYTHSLDVHKYYDEGNEKNRVIVKRKFYHKYIGGGSLDKEYRVLGLSGLKKWDNIKNRERFQTVIEGFFELFFFSRNNMLRDMVIRDLIAYYNEVNNIYRLTEDLDITREARAAVASDENYGLQKPKNVYEWTAMCDTIDPYIEHEILYYFGFKIPMFNILKFRFCNDYLTRRDALNKTICAKINYCSGYNISFNQWFYMNILEKPKDYKNITFKSLHGIFEFPLFIEIFFKKLNPNYEAQFRRVTWPQTGMHYLLDTHHEFPDFITDPASLLLFDNMKKLFEAGKATSYPYKMGMNSPKRVAELDLSKFEKISKIVKLTKEQAFMLFCYFDYFTNNTVLLYDLGGSLEKERIASFGAHSLWDITTYNLDYIDVVLYSRAIRKFDNKRTCEESANFFFDMKETRDIISEIAYAICHNWYFNTNLQDPVGWKYFIEAVAYPGHYYYQRLYKIFDKVTNFTNITFNAMLFSPDSTYFKTLDEIKRKVKIHYNARSSDQACENNYSPYCTKRQMFMTQFYDSIITKFPYPDSDMPPSDSIADWWRIIKLYMDYTIGAPRVPKTFGDPIPLPDKEIVVPIEFSFLKRYFGTPYLNKQDLYHCLTAINLYDTDTLYYIFLNLRDPIVLKDCREFASLFFYNTTKYFLRNVEFGPLFGMLKPDQIIFGYLDYYLEIEHAFLDYLNGDDCTVSPWIGYNPTNWTLTEATFAHYNKNITFKTGSDTNADIRKYVKLFENTSLIYNKPVLDETGDECPMQLSEPFLYRVSVGDSTDGLQFEQFPGKTPKGDTKNFIDMNVLRPLKIIRKTDNDYKYKKLEVNNYAIEFQTDIRCNKGVYIRNGIDMTNFFQMKSVVTKPRYFDIDEPGLIKANVTYSYPIDSDPAPEGFTVYDSYFIVEPYTGITFKYDKKLMTSLVIFFDELYGKLSEGGIGEIVPYYSMYESMRVSDSFIKLWEDNVNSSKTARKAIAVTFVIIGMIFLFVAVGMIVRAFYFKPEDEQPQPSNSDSLLKSIPGDPTLKLQIEPPKQKLLVTEEEKPKEIIKEQATITQETKNP